MNMKAIRRAALLPVLVIAAACGPPQPPDENPEPDVPRPHVGSVLAQGSPSTSSSAGRI
jgi:hypothetical protein